MGSLGKSAQEDVWKIINIYNNNYNNSTKPSFLARSAPPFSSGRGYALASTAQQLSAEMLLREMLSGFALQYQAASHMWLILST